MNNRQWLSDFKQHLIDNGKTPTRADAYRRIAARFLKHVGEDTRLDRLTDETVRGYFKQLSSEPLKKDHAVVVRKFLEFVRTQNNLPAPVRHAGELTTLKQQWSVDKASHQKEAIDQTVALLGRKLIQHYLYFQSRLNGGPESIEELSRMTEECKELVQSNLPLFLRLSASGHNLGSIIDERVQK